MAAKMPPVWRYERTDAERFSAPFTVRFDPTTRAAMQIVEDHLNQAGKPRVNRAELIRWCIKWAAKQIFETNEAAAK